MSARFVLATVLSAVSILVHAAAGPMGYADARHLLARTGFGPTDAEVGRFAELTREQAVATLLRDVRTEAATPPAKKTDVARARTDAITPTALSGRHHVRVPAYWSTNQ